MWITLPKSLKGDLTDKAGRVWWFVDEEQAATVTHISKEKGNVMYLDSNVELWDSLS